MASVWETISEFKRTTQREQIPKEYLLPAGFTLKSTKNLSDVPRRLLSADEVRITENYDATSLAQEIRAGRLTSVDVVRAFCKRAAIAQQLVGLIKTSLPEDKSYIELLLYRHNASRRCSLIKH
jgi:hypothetical protein